MGGNSELLVGEGIDRWQASGDGEGRTLTVVSKFGYASVSKRVPTLAHHLAVAHQLHDSDTRLGKGWHIQGKGRELLVAWTAD